eukprot:TRINITY_DN31766_c0_g1_i1.p1 TRINITY_DN31766_c0_g1~~TRINITY_DN31766_c0_g1_i1.p1  ORF type:complete len:1180 (+),score=207.19 TRINITY_DN31766_c0_g1_i1:426-3965(+)
MLPSEARVLPGKFLSAVAAGEAEMVNRWLEGRDRMRLLAAVDESRRGCVHLAARAGHLDLLRLLYDHGAEMEARDRFGRTPLHIACDHGKRAVVEILLECGSKPGSEDKTGRTSLHIAACCEDSSISKILVGCQPQLVGRRDVHERTPLFYSVLNINSRAQGEVTSLLLDRLAEMNARDTYGMVPLHFAAEEGRRTAVSLLLRRKADATIEDNVNHRTPLQIAKGEHVRQMLRIAMGACGGCNTGQPPVAGPESGCGTAAAGSGSEAEAAAGPGGRSHSGGSVVAAVPARPAPAMVTTVGPAPSIGPSGDRRHGDVSCTPFSDLQARFIRIMERVQEGGLQQMEHIKKPLLWTGSWMADVSTHQQLLGHTLKYVPGPDVAIRVFNLLRPPARFPTSQGDERDIIAYYSEQQRDSGAQAWGGVDPYLATVCEAAEDDDVTYARRVELLRAIHEQRQQLEAKEALVEELRRRVDRLQAELADAVDAEMAKALRVRVSKLASQASEQAEELDNARGSARMLEGQTRVLSEQLAEEKDRSAELVAEQCAVRRRYETEMTRRGEEQSWRVGLEQERQRSEALQRQLRVQLDEVDEERVRAVTAADQLRIELREMQAERSRSAENEATVLEALRQKHRELEARLRQEIASLGQELAEARKAESEAIATVRKLEESSRESNFLRSQLRTAQAEASQVPRLKTMIERLKWEMEEQDREWQRMCNHYPLVAQMLFGSEQPPSDVPAAGAVGPVPAMAVEPTPPKPAATSARGPAPSPSLALAPKLSASTVLAPPPAVPAACVLPPVPMPPARTLLPSDLQPAPAVSPGIVPPAAALVSAPPAAPVSAKPPPLVISEQVALAPAVRTAEEATVSAPVAPTAATTPVGLRVVIVGANGLVRPLAATKEAVDGNEPGSAGGTGIHDASPNPCCKCWVEGRPHGVKTQTTVDKSTGTPQWGHEVSLPDFAAGDAIVFDVRDSDPTRIENLCLGRATVTLSSTDLSDIGSGQNRDLILQGEGLAPSGGILHVKILPPRSIGSDAQVAEDVSDALRLDALLGVCGVVPPGGKRTLMITVMAASGLRNADWVGKSDPYCTVEVQGGPALKFRTAVKKDTLSPEWNEVFEVPDYTGEALVFKVWDKDPMKKDDYLGCANLHGAEIKQGGVKPRQLALSDAGRGVASTLTVQIEERM